MRSPLSWQGGKAKMARKLVTMFPPNILCYASTMVGGAWVLFMLPVGLIKVEYINDIDGDLINFWRVIHDHKDEFIESFRYVPKSREVFMEYKRKLKEHDYKDDIERAHVLFYVCKIGFGSKIKSPSFGTSSLRNSSLNYERLPTIIEEAWGRLKDVMIENQTYQRFVEARDAERTHFFIDPPYHNTSQYNHDSWTDDSYVELASICKGIKGTFLLTINDTELIRKQFADFHIYEHEFQYCIGKDNNDQIVNELIITNYEVPSHTITETKIEKRLHHEQTLSMF